MKNIFFLTIFLAGILTAGCRSTDSGECKISPMEAAYRHLLEHWQPGSLGNARRGYNIAAVLVSPEGKIVAKALNSGISTGNCTRHAEMLLIQNYLEEKRCYNLNGYTVYTTLEPCAMCAATMCMARVKCVYYGQADPDFGGVLERLSRNAEAYGGRKPYPRLTRSEQIHSPLQEALDKAFRQSGCRDIAAWLGSDEAKKIFQEYLPSTSVNGR